jgi:dipeptidyl aminopeptidase/acylaminoacyl peptidase
MPRWKGGKPKAKKGDAASELRAKTEDLLLYDLDVDGVEQLEVLRLDDKRKKLELTGGQKSDLRGVISGFDLDRDGTVAYVSLERAEQPPEIYRLDLFTLQATRETQSDHAGVDESKLVPAQLLSYKTFDGRPISFFWYSKPPAPGMKLPVVISIHGGPEAQAQPYWSAVTQYLALAGYAVAVPNVRGSLGYGKAFSHLDDKEKREDSVRDISELGKFLAARPDVDAKKLVLFGGSYGGYMVLAGLTLYPEQWAAGIDIVGIANFRTFLEQTAPYRRALREAEYGSLDKDGALLDKISPIHKVDKIAAPLMVVHGTRDPRVPIGEAMQIEAALKKRGLPVQLMTFEDEGHGLAKLKNKLIAYPAMIAFLDKNVRGKP